MRPIAPSALAFCILLLGCDKSGEEPKVPDDGSVETLSNDECDERDGIIVGDIGDGAVFEPDYLCSNGQPPIARIVAEEGEPIAADGAVCCGGLAP